MALSDKIAESVRQFNGNYTGENKKYIRKTDTDFSITDNEGINNVEVKYTNINPVSDIKLGKAGEYRVISELMMRNFNPCISCCDEGVDLILENGARIQVKTSIKQSNTFKYKYGNREKQNLSTLYTFSLCHGKNAVNRNKNFDFLICWLVKKDCFYIIPSDRLFNKKTLSINANDYVMFNNWNRKKVPSIWLEYKNNWDLLKVVKNA